MGRCRTRSAGSRGRRRRGRPRAWPSTPRPRYRVPCRSSTTWAGPAGPAPARGHRLRHDHRPGPPRRAAHRQGQGGGVAAQERPPGLRRGGDGRPADRADHPVPQRHRRGAGAGQGRPDPPARAERDAPAALARTPPCTWSPCSRRCRCRRRSTASPSSTRPACRSAASSSTWSASRCSTPAALAAALDGRLDLAELAAASKAAGIELSDRPPRGAGPRGRRARATGRPRGRRAWRAGRPRAADVRAAPARRRRRPRAASTGWPTCWPSRAWHDRRHEAARRRRGCSPAHRSSSAAAPAASARRRRPQRSPCGRPSWAAVRSC